MTVIEDLISGDSPKAIFSGNLDVDPLVESDMLQESQLLSTRLDSVTSTVGLLFEFRTSLQFQGVNTGVMVWHAVSGLDWSVQPGVGAKVAWNVTRSEPRQSKGLFTLEIGFWPLARLAISGESAEFYAGNTLGLKENPTDYSCDYAEVRENLPNWQSTFTPVFASKTNQSGLGRPE